MLAARVTFLEADRKKIMSQWNEDKTAREEAEAKLLEAEAALREETRREERLRRKESARREADRRGTLLVALGTLVVALVVAAIGFQG